MIWLLAYLLLLKREEFKDNNKRVYRIYREEALNLRTKRPRKNRTGAHRLERIELNTLNQVWNGPPQGHRLCARFSVRPQTI